MKAFVGIKRKSVTVDHQEMVKVRTLFEDSLLPLLVEPTVDGVSLISWAELNHDFILNHLRKHGGILFRNFNVTSPDEFERFLHTISPDMLEYKERSSPRSQVSGKVYNSTEYPADQHIFLHNENSYAHSWPKYIGFYCQTAPTEGGGDPNS